MRRIILASSSPRRKQLLKNLGIEFEVAPSDVVENSGAKTPQKLVTELALAKARAVAPKFEDALIVGADTVVYFKGKILGKPKDAEDARLMLKFLSGRTHKVFGGIAVVDSASGKEMVDFVESRVKFRKLPDEIIDAYVRTGEPLDKAGAYAVQEKGSVLVESIDGCYSNVIGLSIPKLVSMLEAFGVKTADFWFA